MPVALLDASFKVDGEYIYPPLMEATNANETGEGRFLPEVLRIGNHALLLRVRLFSFCFSREQKTKV
jgi:hypothetical protein